jgi:F-type H+-transporting ATPase subunit b
MLIDWTTVSFQIVNFLLLVVLLKRFLYGPITQAMQRREEELAAIRAETADKRAEAAEVLGTYQHKQRELDASAASRLQEAEAAAEQRRLELLDQARTEAEAQRLAWRQALQSERQTFLDQLKKRSAGGVLTISRRALAELAETQLETALVRILIRKLETMPAADLERFTAAARTEPLQVHSGWEPEGELQRQLAESLSRACETPVTLDWTYDPDLLLGIQISTDGLRLAWGTEGYLDDLQRSVTALFDQQDAARNHPADAEEKI